MNIENPPIADPVPGAAATERKYLGELFWNQVWQSAGFLAKAVFLVLLSPFMIAHWGAEQYGLFALASSLLVSMGLLDGGVRALTRVRLAEALGHGERHAMSLALGSGVLTFSTVVFAAVGAGSLLGATGLLTNWLNLPPGGSLVLTITLAITGVFMITNLALEPLAAGGRLSLIKAANTWGALVAIPLCGLALYLGARVLPVVLLNLACAVAPNLVLLIHYRMHRLFPWREPGLWSWRTVRETLRAGIWYYLTTVSLIMKGHAFTFIVSVISGPAEAGLFYIVLRVTEILVNVGSTASDTSLALLASAPDVHERRKNFQRCWLYVAVFCAHSAVALTILGGPLLQRWLPKYPNLSPTLGLAMALSGLCGALSRVAVNASMGLGQVRQAARANLVEALLAAVLGTGGFYAAGIPGLLIGSSVGTLVMFPILQEIARLCGSTTTVIYLRPLLPMLPGLALAAAVQAVAGFYPAAWPMLITAGLVTAALAVVQLKAIHRHVDAVL